MIKASKILPKHTVEVMRQLNYICDGCGSIFKGNKTLLDTCNDVNFSDLNVVKYEDNHKMYFLYSPCCEHLHLFGFKAQKQL